MNSTQEKNDKFHAALRDIANQVTWAGVKWAEEDWKHLVLAAKYGQTVAPSPFGHGLLVMNNRRSSKLKKVEMSDLLSEVIAFGDEQGVQWTDPAMVIA